MKSQWYQSAHEKRENEKKRNIKHKNIFAHILAEKCTRTNIISIMTRDNVKLEWFRDGHIVHVANWCASWREVDNPSM